MGPPHSILCGIAGGTDLHQPLMEAPQKNPITSGIRFQLGAPRIIWQALKTSRYLEYLCSLHPRVMKNFWGCCLHMGVFHETPGDADSIPLLGNHSLYHAVQTLDTGSATKVLMSSVRHQGLCLLS